ncbi:hypothetical protein [Saccharolobus islandicus]|uniref:Uncharacterized protein n=1 Tax=Saccharolobus islandicus (strain M.16.4 / Kamchatka \|nr:hypothetical protein [Sulfolobus islandicus]ACR41507.1 hypothetical protein M164_0895 [Sulfolobus islandicus M.16.4]
MTKELDRYQLIKFLKENKVELKGNNFMTVYNIVSQECNKLNIKYHVKVCNPDLIISKLFTIGKKGNYEIEIDESNNFVGFYKKGSGKNKKLSFVTTFLDLLYVISYLVRKIAEENVKLLMRA